MNTKLVTVDKPIGASKKFSIFTGTQTHVGVISYTRPVIVKIASSFEYNDVLTAEASHFTTLSMFAKELADIQKQSAKDVIRYDLLFAKLSGSFIDPTRNDCRLNVFDTVDIEIDKLTPMGKLMKDTKIDTRTSVWILGRILKLYSLFELMAASESSPYVKYPLFSIGNFLISPEKHRVVYYNFPGEIEDVTATELVKAVTTKILKWIEPRDDDPNDTPYMDMLKALADNGSEKFELAHSLLYLAVERLWGISYHPFTYKNVQTDTSMSGWNTIKEE